MRTIKFTTMNFKVALFALLSLMIASALMSCSQSGISGKVIDPANKVLEGVTVKVDKSNFITETEPNGEYTIEYAPGSFKLIFSKNGYTTHTLELNITNMTLFPAETIMMYPIPKEKGIYLLEGNRLVSLTPFPIKKNEYRRSNKNYTSYKVDTQNIFKSQIIKSDVIKFIDTSPDPIRFARLKKNGLIEDYYSEWMDIKYKYDGFIDDKQEKVGEEKILLRSISANPGIYALIGVYKAVMSGRIHPDVDKKSFPFIVSHSENDKQEIKNRIEKIAEVMNNPQELSLDIAKKCFLSVKKDEKIFQTIKDSITKSKTRIVDFGAVMPGENINEAYIKVRFKREEDNEEVMSDDYRRLVKVDGEWYAD